MENLTNIKVNQSNKEFISRAQSNYNLFTKGKQKLSQTEVITMIERYFKENNDSYTDMIEQEANNNGFK